MRGKVERKKRKKKKNVRDELTCFAIEILKTREFYVTITSKKEIVDEK